MPRGYLKHQKGVSRKQARGGSSHRGGSSVKKHCDKNQQQVVDEDLDFTLSVKKKKNLSLKIEEVDSASSTVVECPICFEDTPIINLSKYCKWHDTACRKCLHRIFVADVQGSVKNYPLRCFHPLCNQKIGVGPLKMKVFETDKELQNHNNMTALAQVKMQRGTRTLICPKCEMPKGISERDLVNKKNWLEQIGYTCNRCQSKCQVNQDIYPTVLGLERMRATGKGIYQGWAQCPKCSIVITKDFGCDHMHCGYCSHNFSWRVAQKAHAQLARPPLDEIHRWWW